MKTQPTLCVDGREVAIEGERNLLELIRKANIDLPTFCYHSELSVYGACRLCLVEVQGRGIVAACSTPPEPGLNVRTTTEEIREIRRVAVELLLANHKQSCPTCSKSASCQLQSLAQRLGIQKVRFKPMIKDRPLDDSSAWLVRDPNKCVLCGDCVRMCAEVQGIGAIDFAFRGAGVAVLPAFGKNLSKVECVGCGQCARVCPTGALVPKSEVEQVWYALQQPNKVVVAQIAPAVRVALGEMFGLAPGELATGQIVAALKRMGFARVFDTAFAADLTAIEETQEFLDRRERGESGPLMTSCCPAWVRFAEQYYPDLLDRLSTCRSPQQMLGAVAKQTLPASLGIDPSDLVVVAIMPCTAKKGEAKLPQFRSAAGPDVDHVLTTLELGQMIEEAGLRFSRLEPESLDLPLGFKTGAGLVFGASGGVSEAVLRVAAEKLAAVQADTVEFPAVRGREGFREVSVRLGQQVLRLAVVQGLANAKMVAERVRRKEADYDLIEVMACPGGCVCGAGNPAPKDSDTRQQRTHGLYNADKTVQLHRPQDNPYVQELYDIRLMHPGSEVAHALLHSHHHSRKRIQEASLALVQGSRPDKLEVRVCVGTSCYVRGAQDLLRALINYIEELGAEDQVDVKASFCHELCDRGPTVRIGSEIIEKCTFHKACEVLDRQMSQSSGTHERSA